MDTIRVNASTSYNVLVGPGLLSEAGTLITEAVPKARAAMIVSDDNVYPLYGEALKAALVGSGLELHEFVFPHGEQNKTLATWGRLLECMSSARMTRSDFVIALGGGIVGDLAGFAAAAYQRGIRFVQVPTSLLADVDASVGGKTAVDLESGKNQVGAFHQPSLVICDTGTLNTLPAEQFQCGAAEVIKTAILRSPALFERVAWGSIAQEDISECIAIKRDFVTNDEFDTGIRMQLNLGHTIGHAVEACSHYTILHGQAVAIGTAVITRAAVKRGICAPETLDKVLAALKSYSLPTETNFTVDELYAASLLDKKASGGTLRIIVPERIGSCRVETIRQEELRDWMLDGGIA